MGIWDVRAESALRFYIKTGNGYEIIGENNGIAQRA